MWVNPWERDLLLLYQKKKKSGFSDHIPNDQTLNHSELIKAVLPYGSLCEWPVFLLCIIPCILLNIFWKKLKSFGKIPKSSLSDLGGGLIILVPFLALNNIKANMYLWENIRQWGLTGGNEGLLYTGELIWDWESMPKLLCSMVSSVTLGRIRNCM